MKVFVKPAQTESRREMKARAKLIAVFDACTACELASTLAADTFARRQASQSGLIACAEVFGETAFQLSRLVVPDADRVRDELIACRAACALAREACEALDDDAVAQRCALECKRCEEACDEVLPALRMAA